MPVGVPKVPYLIEGDEEESVEYVDLYNILYRERLLFLGQEIKAQISNQIMGLLVYLSIEDSEEDIYIFINSNGGLAYKGIGIFDTMHFVKPDVQTVCMGLAASMAAFVLLGGEITKRIAFPHARVMIRQPHSSFFEAPAGDFILASGELLKLRERIVEVYSIITGKPSWIINEDMERNFFMSADEAKDYGIVDLVGE